MTVLIYLGVAQLVARYLGVVEAAGSSPVTQTKNKALVLASALFLSNPKDWYVISPSEYVIAAGVCSSSVFFGLITYISLQK